MQIILPEYSVIPTIYSTECILNVLFSFIIMTGGFTIWRSTRRWSAAAITLLGVQNFFTATRITMTNVLEIQGIGPGTFVGSIQLGMVTLLLGYVAYLLLMNKFLKNGILRRKDDPK